MGEKEGETAGDKGRQTEPESEGKKGKEAEHKKQRVKKRMVN